jgi:serine/threonine-protein kinase
MSIFRARPAEQTIGPGCYAIKTATTASWNASIALAMVRREARVASEVAHPNLVSTLAAGVVDDHPHLAMPFLEGVTLWQLLRLGRSFALPIASALWIVRQMATALSALHAAGWLHGQVRPEHVMISPQGHATVIDLSQARRLGTAECDLDGALEAPHYSAPETFGSRGQLNAASETYSLGIVLFEALAGRAPFVGTDPRRLARCHRSEAPPDLRQLRAGVSMEVDQLVRRMLSKEPLRRPSDEELVRWLAELEIEELGS